MVDLWRVTTWNDTWRGAMLQSTSTRCPAVLAPTRRPQVYDDSNPEVDAKLKRGGALNDVLNTTSTSDSQPQSSSIDARSHTLVMS